MVCKIVELFEFDGEFGETETFFLLTFQVGLILTFVEGDTIASYAITVDKNTAPLALNRLGQYCQC